MGVFACGWLGFVFTRGACSCGCLRFLGVGALVGWWDSVAASAPLPRLACLRAHALVWACWRVREPVGGQVRGR